MTTTQKSLGKECEHEYKCEVSLSASACSVCLLELLGRGREGIVSTGANDPTPKIKVCYLDSSEKRMTNRDPFMGGGADILPMRSIETQ